METISYNQALDLWCDLCGLRVDALLTEDEANFNRLFGRVIRRGWEWYFWPFLMLLEQRYFRDAWAAGSYASGAEVYHAATDKYWSANAAAIAGDVPGVSTKWTQITNLDAYVGWEQTGKTALGTVRAIYRANPRTSSSAARLNFVPDERGVTIVSTSVPTSVWVSFRKRCPAWRGADYSAAATYASGLTRYYASSTEGFDGDFWTTIAATSAGESPETTAAKWSKIEVPSFLCDFAVAGAKIGFLEGDGQLDKALANEGSLWTNLYDEVDKIEGQSGAVRLARVANV